MNTADTPVAAQELQLADIVRAACVRAALDGYERAAFDGLCHEGAWECAVEAMRMLDLDEVVRAARRSAPGAG
jgi:hypothetical protein